MKGYKNECSIADDQTKNLVVSLNKEIKYPSNKNVGIIRVTMLSKDFFPNMFNEDKLKNNQMFIIDTEDLDIKTDENNFMLKNLNFDREQFKKFFKDNLKKL